MTIHSRMSGFGWFVPPKTISNQDLATQTDTSHEWIVSRTGIRTRHILDEGVPGTDMAHAASRDALQRAGRTPEDVTHVIYCTCTPDALCPSSACTLSHKLGIVGHMAVDVNAACSGFINGMELADGIVARHPSACVLLVAAECLSHRCNWQDRSTCVLFGDGAAAVLVTGNGQPGSHDNVLSGTIVDIDLGADGSKGELLSIGGGTASAPYKLGDTVGPEYFIRMNGGMVFKHAVRSMTASCLKLLERNGLGAKDVDLFIPHQANLRIIEAVGERLDIRGDTVFLNVDKYGNTSAASIPLAMGEAVDQGMLKPGMRVLLTTFGGGLTWGSALMRF